MYDRYARYGIWGEPTTQQSGLEKGIGVAGGIQNLFGKQYENIIAKYRGQNEALNAQENEQTLPGRIGSANVKNQTDMSMYPQMQQAKLNQEQQTIKEIMSRTGLNYAQASEAGARTGMIGTQTNMLKNPGYEYDTLYQQWQNSPAGSPRKSYFAGVLNNMMGAPGGLNLSGKKDKTPTANGGAQTPSVQQGGTPGSSITLNPLGGSPRAGFHQGVYTDPSTGETQTIESPTTASATRNQNRLEANSELGGIEDTLKSGFDPYMGPFGGSKLMFDSLLTSLTPNSNSGKEASDRLVNYNTANRLKREAANIISRQSAGQAPGVEAAREQEQSSFGSLPSSFANYFIPKSIANQSFKNYFPLQQKLAQSAVNQERTGYSTPGSPDFVKTPARSGYFDSYGYNEPQGENQINSPAQNNQPQQVTPSQLTELAKDAIARGAPPELVNRRLQEQLKQFGGKR